MASKQEIQAGKAFVRLFLKNDMAKQLSRALKSAGAQLQSFGRGVMARGAVITGVGAAILAPLTAAVKAFADTGDTLDKMSQRTGVAASSLAELGFAAEQSGASLGQVEAVLLKMNRRFGRVTAGAGTANQISALEELGLSVDQLRSMDAEGRFMAIGDAIAQYGDDAAAAGLAQRVFGTGIDAILPLLKQGKEGIEALRAEARDLGIVPTDKEIANAAKVTDAINRIRVVFKATIFDIGAGLAEPAMRFLETAKRIGLAIKGWVKNNIGLITSAAAMGVALVAVGSAITALGAVIFGAGIALSTLGTIVGAVLSPVGLLVAAVVGGAVAWVKFSDSGQQAWGTLKAAILPIIETIMATIGGVKDALMSGDWELAGKIAMAGLKLAVLQGLGAIREAFPETFGTILRVVGKIGDGLVTAWGKVTGFLTDQWNNWGKRTLDTVIGVASRISQIWQQTVVGMANWMLETSAKGGIMGKAMSAVLGVDLAEEQKKSDRLNRDLGLGPTDVLADARKAVKQYTDGLVADAKALDGEPGTGKVSESLEAFLTKLESGTGIQDAAKELGMLRLKAAIEAEKARKARADAARDEAAGGDGASKGGGAAGLAAAIPTGVALTATYSAAAASISGFQAAGGGPEEKIASSVAISAENSKQMLIKMGLWLDQNKISQSLMQQFLAAWKVS